MRLVYKGNLYESINNKTLIVVDIQPEYESYMHFKVSNFTNWINTTYSNYSNIIFLFNGPELGFPSEGEYIYWLIENGLSEELVDIISFYDKGYNYFRYAMDNGIDEDDIVKLIIYMVKNDINDSRDIEDYSVIGLSEETTDLFEDSGDMIYIPDVLEYLGNVNGELFLVGGAKDECLREVELCLRANNKQYKLINEWVY